MANESVNYWKFATLGVLLVGATVGATLLVVGRDSKTGSPDAQTAQMGGPVLLDENARLSSKAAPVEPQRGTRVAHPGRNTSGALPPPPPYPPQTAYPPQPAYPPQSVMEACNRYANEQVSSKAENVLKNAALGAAIGAAVGAAPGKGPPSGALRVLRAERFTGSTKVNHGMRSTRVHTHPACTRKVIDLEGPVNIYFAPAVLHEKGEGKARSAGHSGPMAKLCNAAPAFLVRNPKGRDGFRPALRYSPLTEAHSCRAARASC